MNQNYKTEYTPCEYEMSQFKAMEGKYATENERHFFETMLRKIRTQYTDANETIISYENNEDEIYLYREGYDDFEVGRYSKEVSDSPVFTNGLFGILSVDLGKDLLSVHITLLDWLRKDDFKCVQYNNWEG